MGLSEPQNEAFLKAVSAGKLQRDLPGKISFWLYRGDQRVRRRLTNLDRGRLKAALLGVRRWKHRFL